MPKTSKSPKSAKIHFSELVFLLLGLVLPFQFGKHFWPASSYLSGIRMDYLSPTLYLTDLVLLLVFAVKFFKQQFKFKGSLLTPEIILAGLLLIINFFVAEEPGLFFYRLFQYLKLAIIIWIFRKSTKKEAAWFLKGIIFTSFLALILAIQQIANQGSLQGIWYFLGERSFTINSPGISTVSLAGKKLLRGYAFFSHPNSLAGFFLPLVFVFLAFKNLPAFLLAIMLIFLSFSKFALILLAAGLWFWFKKPSVFFLLIVWFLLSFKGDPLSLNSRINSFFHAFNFALQHPLGLGLGHYLHSEIPPFPQPVHNIFLLLTLELGWLVWPFLLMGGEKLLLAAKKNRLSLFVLGILFLCGNFDHYLLTLNQNLLLLGVFLGLITGPWTRQKIPN